MFRGYYDINGNITNKIDGRGISIRSTYDALDRLNGAAWLGLGGAVLGVMPLVGDIAKGTIKGRAKPYVGCPTTIPPNLPVCLTGRRAGWAGNGDGPFRRVIVN